jgi:hypothetical protein
VTGDLGAPGWQRKAAAGIGAYVDADRFSRTAVSKAAAGGTCQAVLPAVPDGDLWLIERIVVTCTSSTATTAVVYVDQASASSIVEGTQSGNLDFADENQPIEVDGSRALLVVWSGASNGAIGTVRAQIRVLRRLTAPGGA